MEKVQKVYIKGDHKKGREIIKLLEKLGGRNTLSYTGINEDAYYFINPDGIITLATPTLFPYLKKSHYKEIKLPRWKPKYGDYYYWFTSNGLINQNIWHNSPINDLYYEFGNCFKTFEKAEAARDKIKELLNKQ